VTTHEDDWPVKANRRSVSQWNQSHCHETLSAGGLHAEPLLEVARCNQYRMPSDCTCRRGGRSRGATMMQRK
jgi:hypothetical protein